MMPSPTTGASPATASGAAPLLRKIVHVDMDAFFASVEQLDDPSLKGRPIAVGGDAASRGVVSTASYEARGFGVRSAMPMSKALRLCPELVCVRPRFARYVEVSRGVMEILRRVTPLVEPISLDEAYLDVSGLPEPAGEIAARLKALIASELSLTASAGVAPCKLVAKIASDLCKPDGLLVVKPARVRGFLSPLPVGRLWGVGPVTERKLRSIGLATIGALAGAKEDSVKSLLGPGATQLIRLARGDDDRPVVCARPTRSISSERTLPQDTRDLSTLDRLIDRFGAELETALRAERMRARTIVLKLRYSDFRGITRSRTFRTPFDEGSLIAREARRLLARTGAGRTKVRLVGVGVSGLMDVDQPHQQPLFPE